MWRTGLRARRGARGEVEQEHACRTECGADAAGGAAQAQVRTTVVHGDRCW
jgi:hypothetical protein